MKTKIDRPDNKIKRRISAVMVAAILLTSVGSVTYFRQQKVEAKETLYSIEKVIKDLETNDETFSILEIVPDTVSGNLNVKDLSGNKLTVSVDQLMGFTGYYVGGSEPIRFDVDDIVNNEHTISGAVVSKNTLYSAQRYEAVNALYNVLLSYNELTNENTGAFSLRTGYGEVRQGERLADQSAIMDPDTLDTYDEATLKSNGYAVIANSAKAETIDIAMGKMEPVDLGSNYAKYVLKYERDKSVSEDILKNFLESYRETCSVDNLYPDYSDEYFSTNFSQERSYRSFDPLLKSVENEAGSTNKPNVRAIFMSLSDNPNTKLVKRGYVVEETFNYPDTVAHLRSEDKNIAIPENTPLYTKDENGRFVFDHLYNKETDDPSLRRNNNESNGTEEGQTEQGNENEEPVQNTEPDTVEQNTDEQDTDEQNDTDNINIVVPDNNTSNPDIIQGDISRRVLNAAGIDNNFDDSTENVQKDLWVVKFKYVDNSNSDAAFSDYYGISAFKYFDSETEDTGAEYQFDIKNDGTIIVPNLLNNGTIVAKDTCPINYLVYDYIGKGVGTYAWTGSYTASDTVDLSKMYRIRGAKVYYRYGIENKEWFKRYVFDRDIPPYDNATEDTGSKLKVRVDTVPAAKVRPSDVLDHKMVVISSGSGMYCIGGEAGFNQYRADDIDISYEVYIRLIGRATEERLPVVADYNIVNNEGKLLTKYRDSLVYNLVNALALDDLSQYYNVILQYSHQLVSGHVSGNEVSPFKFAKDNSKEIRIKNEGDFVKENRYFYKRTKSDSANRTLSVNFLNETFYTPEFSQDIINNGFEEVKQDIDTENWYRENDAASKDKKLTNDIVTQATAIRYIIGLKDVRVTSGKAEIKILEIEPVACWSLEKENRKIEGDEYNQLSDEKKESLKHSDGNIYEGKLYLKGHPEKTIFKQQGLYIKEIKQMTTAEFIGHIEDLNAEYDMIYIGMNTGADGYIGNPAKDTTYGALHHRVANDQDVRNNRASKTGDIITAYNDSNMDGLVYCNVGDFAYITEDAGGSLRVKNGDTMIYPEFADESSNTGSLKTYDQIQKPMSMSSDKGYSHKENGEVDYSNYSLYRSRYNGNDITAEKAKNLVEFAESGYPVILAEDFFAYDRETDERKWEVNQCTVDNSSYMYSAIKDILSDKDKYNHVFRDTDIYKSLSLQSDVVDYVVKLGKPVIELKNDRALTSLEEPRKLSEEDKDAEGYYYLIYDFEISNQGSAPLSAKYNVGLFIDINADGKYSVKNEGINFQEIRKSNNEKIDPVGTDEYKMNKYELEAGVRYEAVYKLSGSYVGCLPWRLRVSRVDNKLNRSNVDGCFYIRNNEEELNILQIRPNNVYGTNPTWDMQADLEDSTSAFHNLIEGAGNKEKIPYKLSITGKIASELTPVVASARHKNAADLTGDDYYEYFKDNYKMLVIGYADVYRGPDKPMAEGIKKYIKNGYSVLFTHDCTSFVNSEVRSDGFLSQDWGYEFNSIIRNVVGMDRYNVLHESTHVSMNEVPYKPRSNKDIILDFETHGYTYQILNYWGYHRPENKLAACEGEWTKYMSRNRNGQRWANNNDFMPYENLVGTSIGSGIYHSNIWISKVNDGQITKYPFKLDEDFVVSPTHAQYYQLDFTADDDNDGESDIVVWYCLNTADDEDYGDKCGRREKGILTSQVNTYNISPRDVRNNYYIYNKGNVTYSGVGHSKPTKDQELKLFINTMIAAYRAGLHEPEIEIVDGYGKSAKKAKQIYVSYDDQIRKMVSSNAVKTELETDGINTNSDIDDTVDMYFKSEQLSLVQNASSIDHNMYAKVFIEGSGPTLSTYGVTDARYKDIQVNMLDLYNRVCEDVTHRILTKISGATGNEEFKNNSVEIKNGTTYKVEIPVGGVGTENLWGGIDKTGSDLINSRRIFVIVTDYAKYKNQAGDVYDTKQTPWAVDEVKLSRVDMFDID